MSENNDADKRPRMYGQVRTEDGIVELTVQGAEGETTDDIESTFDDRIDKLTETSERLTDSDEDSNKMCQ